MAPRARDQDARLDRRKETVPLLIERLSDRNRYVRESAVRALGRIGDPLALPSLAELFRSTGRVAAGVVYDALVAFGREAEPVFAGALGSEIASVRVASCFGVAALSEPDNARQLLEPLLRDGSAPVRSAAAESLGQVAGERLPEALAQATRDEQATVRSAATGALGSYDDPRGVELAVNALRRPRPRHRRSRRGVTRPPFTLPNGGRVGRACAQARGSSVAGRTRAGALVAWSGLRWAPNRSC